MVSKLGSLIFIIATEVLTAVSKEVLHKSRIGMYAQSLRSSSRPSKGQRSTAPKIVRWKLFSILSENFSGRGPLQKRYLAPNIVSRECENLRCSY
ncbi:hypothetical protein F5Y02DRAFT_389589 [Annulohypoxylon stygium]|nr:hypothetical protein F5Y02DRAFT_389589 [Annulohypoxylon stygium]